MDLKKKAITGFKLTSASSFIIAISQIIQLLVLSRLLDATDFGLWAIVNMVIFYATVFSDLGISASVIHFQNTDKKQLSTLFWINILTSAFLFVVIWIFSPLILSIFGEVNQKPLLIVSALSLPMSASGILFQNLLQKDMEFAFLSVTEIISTIIGVFVAIFFAIKDFGVWSFVFGQLTKIFVKSFILTVKGFFAYRINFYFNLKIVNEYLKFGFYQIGEKSFNILNQRLDQVLVGALISVEALGYYNFALNLISKPVSVLNPIFTKVSFPLFAKIQDKTDKLRSTYLKLVKVISNINSLIYWLIFILAPLFVPLFFGEKWQDSIILIQILSGVAYLRSIANPVGSLILAKGRADLGFKWNFVLTIITLPSVYFTGVFFGPIGIALALLTLQVLLFFPNYLFLVKPFIGSVFREYYKAIIKGFLFGMSMLISIFIFKGIQLHNYYLLISLQFSVCVIIYFMQMFIFEKKFIDEIKGLLKTK